MQGSNVSSEVGNPYIAIDILYSLCTQLTNFREIEIMPIKTVFLNK